MRVSFFFILLLSVFSLPLAGQVYTYHVSGEALLQEHEQTKKLLPEQEITQSHKVILRGNAQTVLFNQSGQRIALNKPGTYSYPIILQAFAKNRESLTEAYLGYLWKKLNKKKKGPEQLGSSPVAGVSRGDAAALLLPADSALIIAETATFTWEGAADAYHFTLANERGVLLLEMELPAPPLTLNFAVGHLKGNRLYQWWVSEAGQEKATTQKRVLIVLDKEYQANYQEQVAQIHAIASTMPVSENIGNITDAYLRAWALEQIAAARH